MSRPAERISPRGLRAAFGSGSRHRSLPAAGVVLGATLVLSACTPIVLPGPPPGSPPLSAPSMAPPVVVPTTTSPAPAEPSAPVTTTTPAATTTVTPPTTTPATTAPVTTTSVTTPPTTTPATTAPVTTTTLLTTPPTQPAPVTADAAVRQQILDLVNTERAAAGCPAVVMDAQLSAAAQGHAEDMAAKNYFSHTGADGRSPFDRIKAAGYTKGGYQGENIARGQADAAAVMTGWMNSEGHRANILNCVYDDLGVGYTRNGRGPYWVQNFGGVR